jgi:hypothetical protein
MKNFKDNERQFLPDEVNLILETATKNSPENQPDSLSESQLYEIARLFADAIVWVEDMFVDFSPR